jgi:hypothetical protein
LYEGDFERLEAYFPQVTASVTIRKLVRNLLNELDKRTAEKAPTTTSGENDDVSVSIDNLGTEES